MTRRVHFYNGGLVRAFLTRGSHAELVAPHLADPERWPSWSSLLFELNAWDSLVDRTGALPHPLEVENLRPMPAVETGFDASLEQLCQARARELAALDRPIRVFWSGGIDSTLVLVSLLVAQIPHEQLEVVYTAESKREFPSFLAEHLPATVRRTEVLAFPHHTFVPDAEAEAFRDRPCMGDFLDPTCVNVTGGLGDKLFNSHTLLKRFGYQRALLPYAKVLPGALLEATEPLCARCPLPLTTLSSFLWWIYFALYYQDELLQVLGGVSGTSVAAQRAALHVFFDAPGFQQWSLHHRDRVATADPTKLKLDAKRLIHAYTGDDEYLRSKLKSGSLKFRKTPGVRWDSPILFILDDGSLVRAPASDP